MYVKTRWLKPLMDICAHGRVTDARYTFTYVVYVSGKIEI